MTKSKTLRRLLCLLLTLTMVLSLAVPAVSAENEPEQIKTASEQQQMPAQNESTFVEQDPHSLDEIVRVTIELEGTPTLDAGYPMERIAENRSAVNYRAGLRANQDAMTARIEKTIGSELDVKWNITLAMNAISANVRYGDIPAIKAITGVKDVFLENQYEAPKDVEEGDHPNTANTSTYMVGAADTWAEGYTGAGSRIAIIDTGLDTTHQSVNADAFNYAIQQTGKTVSLFTSSDLSAIKSQLNGSSATYVSAKIPFGYNYVDENTTIDHLSDTNGEHGSHVAGIAAANRYIKSGSSYVDAASTVHAVGMAPDAQLFIMKVFGAAGGAYDSDYMVAIEDAIVLGCDAVNLSLGSSVQGFAYSTSYQATMNKIANSSSNTKTVVSISAGNAYDFAYMLSSDEKELYIDDVYMHTGGSPGSYVNSLCVAAAENTGVVGAPLTFNGNQTVFYTETDSTGAKMKTVAGSYSYVYIDAPGNASDYSTVNSSTSLSGKVVLCNRGDISFYEKGNNLTSYRPKALLVANNVDGSINMALDSYTGTFPMVAITLADANTIKANSEAHTAGSITYYTGTVVVSGTDVSTQLTDNPEMTAFSSWGVPGSLLMKPEITAPGGDIYSIFGTNKTSSGTTGGSDQYELMSGTSMAAPHVTGLTGTLGQYIREKNLSVSGRTTRQLAQSLLMSTAVPMHIGSKTGPYYPVIQVGAGLINVHQAVHASSAIFMKADATMSYADGKVKAELGDLPDKQGAWTYSFEINNMASKAQTYELRTDLFTQDRDTSGTYPMMSRSTTPLDWPVTYKVDGASTTSVTVPAGGSKTVSVTITVPTDNSAFDELYPSGAYLEGYTFVKSSTTSSDGELLDVEHSIPILGFYGSWTDPSMFDNMSYVDNHIYGETRTPYSGVTDTNYMTYKRGSTTNYVTGNPYTAEQPFPYEKLALRSTDTIYQIKYNLVRAAGTTGFAVSLLDDGDQVTAVKSASVSSTNVTGMYYSQTSSAWQGTSSSTYSANKTVSTYGSEGDHIRVGFYAIPEYNAMKVNSDLTSNTAGYLTSSTFETVLKQNVLGRGAMVGYDFFIDNTAPEILSAVTNGSSVTVTVQDNCYVAWLAIVSNAGTTTYASAVPNQTAKGEAVTCTFDISSLNLAIGSYKVLAGDYASNETTVAPTENLYDIIAESNNTAWGTVSVTGNVITAVPTEGYYAAGYEVLSGTASVAQNGNYFTVNASSDCTIRINFAAKQPITVTYVSSGTVMSTAASYSADDVVLPTAATEYDGWTFVGWSGETIAETAEVPTFYAPGATVNPLSDATYYAVYTRIEGNAGNLYRLLTAMPDPVEGNYLISSGKTTSSYLMNTLDAGTNYYRNSAGASTFTALGATIEDNVAYNVPTANVFHISPSTDSGYYFINSVSNNTYVADSSNGLTSNDGTSSVSLRSWSMTLSGSAFVMATEQYSTYSIALNTTYNAFDTIRNSTGVYLWAEEPAGTTYYSTTPVDAEHEHVLEHHAAAAATCGADGNTEYWTCTVCGKCFSDANGETEITLADTVIPATGEHTWGQWFTNNNGTHTRVCSVCGASETVDCTYTDTVVAPTPIDQGYTKHTCSVCGYSYKDNYVDPTGYDFTVTFTVPSGVTPVAAMLINNVSGATLPTAEAPDGYAFLGWVLEDYNNVTEQPAAILTGLYKPTADVTLKALYTYIDGGTGDKVYKLVSTAPTDWSGNYAITYQITTSLIALTGVTPSSNGAQIEDIGNATVYASTGMTLDGTTLSNVADAYVFVVEKQGDYYSIKSKATGAYLGLNSSSYLSGYTTYDSELCNWTPGTQANCSSATSAKSTSYPYLSYSTNYSYFWTGGSSAINTGGPALNIRWWKEAQLGTSYYTTIIGEAEIHTPIFHAAVDATCTENGTVAYYTCAECAEGDVHYGKFYSDEALTNEITDITVPAAGHTPGDSVIENMTPATCTAAGGYDMVVYCSVCGAEMSREHTTIDAPGHNPGTPVEENRVEPTADIDGGYDTVVYCTRCNAELSREHTVLPATGSVLKFKRATLSLESDISINFYVLDSVLEGYTDPYVVFTKEIYDNNGNVKEIKTETVDTFTLKPIDDVTPCHVFTFAGINSTEMGSKVTATLYATKNGQTVEGQTVNYSVLTYVKNMLSKTTDAKFRTLLVDLLNYGASAQTYFVYNTANLVNKDLTAEQQSWATQDDPRLENHKSKTVNEGATVHFKTVTLKLEEKISMYFYLNLEEYTGDVNDLEAHMTFNGQEIIVDGSTFPTRPYSGVDYKVAIMDRANALQMRQMVTVELFSKTTHERVSDTVTYSIVSFANSKVNDTDTGLKTLTQNMIKYGDAARAYFVG